METIKIYLENMFGRLPETTETQRLKEDLLTTMEDKYNELKSEGKSENEAIGVVISEFGNIDELIQELGIEMEKPEKAVTEREAKVTELTHVLTEEEVGKYIQDSKRYNLCTAIGVFLCILSPISPIFTIAKFGENRGMIGFVVTLFLVAIAVGLFIYGGVSQEKYQYLRQECLELPKQLEIKLRKGQEAFRSKYISALISGVLLCIISPIPLLMWGIRDMEYLSRGISGIRSVCISLAIAAVAVFILVYFGTAKERYSLLLQTGEYTIERKQRNKKTQKLTESIGAVYWPVVVAIYLFWSFTRDAWSSSWLIWPIAGVLFAAISGIIQAIKGKDE